MDNNLANDPENDLSSGHQKSKIITLGKKFRLSEFLAEKTISSVAFISFAVMILIFVFIFKEAFPVFFPSQNKAASNNIELKQETYGDDESVAQQQKKVETNELQNQKNETPSEKRSAIIKNLKGREWQPVSDEPKYGLTPLIYGSLKVSLIAMALGIPLALLAAIFTSVFAPKWAKELLKPAIEILAGIPSVVIGFFAMIVLATFMQNIFGFQYRLNAFVGGVAMAFAIIPVIYTVTEDSLDAVPKSFKEASFALGATKWETALFVVLPAATPGIFAAILLGFGRAFGETMIVLMATGNAALTSLNIFEPVRSMTATIGAEMGEAVFGDAHYSVLFLIGVILFIFTFLLNALAEVFIRQKLIKKFRGY